MEILHFKGSGDTENHNEHSLGVYLVIDNLYIFVVYNLILHPLKY